MIIDGKKGSSGSSGGGSAPAPPRAAIEEANTLRSKATLRVVEVLSEGEIEGLVDGDKSVYLNDTQLQNDNGSYNFSGVTVVTRDGTPDQDYIPGFSSVEDEVSVGVKLTSTVGGGTLDVIRTITDLDTDAVRITILVNGLSYQDLVNGDMKAYQTGVYIFYTPSGGSEIQAFHDTIVGKTTSPYERAYRVQLTGTGPWDIRVRRAYYEQSLSNYREDTFWSRYTRIVDEKLIYPDTAVVATSVDSVLFGSDVPQRSYLIKGLKIKVPSNYTPSTRHYSGAWDGTFQTLWSDNPAWVLYDILSNNRYGLGQVLNVSQIDKYGLYTIAQYCDEYVNGEPRFTFNACIQSQEDAFKVAQAIASSFRGMIFWGASDLLTMTQDAPEDAVKIYSDANVIDGMFTYSGTALNSRHSVAYVSWNNPEDNYRQVIEVVEDPALLELYGLRQLDVAAYGCTSRSQAHRFGKWLLDEEANETEFVDFVVGLADADIRPGQIVKIADSSYASIRFGGRLVSGTTTSIVLDAAVTFESGKTYIADVVLPNGTVESLNVTNTPSTTASVTLSGTFSAAPEANTMWVITASDLAPRKFRVIGVKEKDGHLYQVTALLYDETKYARVEQSRTLPALNFSSLQKGALTPPTNITTEETLFQTGVLKQSAITISWQPSTDPRACRYEVEALEPDSAYRLFGGTTGCSFDVKTTYDGVWSFRVRAFDALNNASPYLETTNVTLVANSTPPDDVTGFAISTSGELSTLKWDVVTSINLDHYEIRYNRLTTGADWNSSQTIIRNVSGNTSATVQTRAGSYLIKAVSKATTNFPFGVFSSSPAIIATEISALDNFNFIETVQEDSAFTGAMVDVVLDGTDLQLDVDGDGNFLPEGTYTFDNEFDLGDVYTFKLSTDITVNGLNVASDVDTYLDVDAVLNWDEVSESDWGIQVQVRTTSDNPAGSPTWSDWVDLDVSDHQARAGQLRIKLYSYNLTVTPLVSRLRVDVDMPDSLRDGNDIVVSAVGGSTITYTTPFRTTTPSIAIAAQNLSQGDYWIITAKDEAGFHIQFKNAAGTSVSRTFDYVAKGYGSVV